MKKEKQRKERVRESERGTCAKDIVKDNLTGLREMIRWGRMRKKELKMSHGL